MSVSLSDTASTYLAAVTMGIQPTTYVSERYGISHSAAAKRVHRARQAGLLPATSRGRSMAGAHRPVTARLSTDFARTWKVCEQCLVAWPCPEWMDPGGLRAAEASASVFAKVADLWAGRSR